MHFSCKSKDLLKGVSLISNICQSKTTKPILQDIKVDVDQNTIQLLGTDLEVAIKYTLSDAEIMKKGSVVIPAVKLLNMLREITSEVA